MIFFLECSTLRGDSPRMFYSPWCFCYVLAQTTMATGHPKPEAYSAFRLETRDFTQEMTHFTDNGVLSPEHMAAMSPRLHGRE